jgi:hypothetical protein
MVVGELAARVRGWWRTGERERVQALESWGISQKALFFLNFQ